jgi:hypothetical protein
MSAIDCAVTNEDLASCAEDMSGRRSSTVSAVYCKAVRPNGRTMSSSRARTASSTCLTRYSSSGGAGSGSGMCREYPSPRLSCGDWAAATGYLSGG